MLFSHRTNQVIVYKDTVHANDESITMKKLFMKNTLTDLARVFLIMLTLSAPLWGQSYFNILMLDQFNAGHARDIALPGAAVSDYSGPQSSFYNPATQGDVQGVRFSGSLLTVGMTEDRSYPAIDQFGDRVTDNIYVVSRGNQLAFAGGVSWGMPHVSVSVGSLPLATPAFFYKEEVRGSLYPPNVNRDPLVGYHHIENAGVLQSSGVSTAYSHASWSVGAGLRMLHGLGLTDSYGITVLNDVDTLALASGSTLFREESWQPDNTPVIFNLGLVKDLGLHWRLSAAYQSGFSLEAKRQGAIPVYDSTAFYPLVQWGSDTLQLTTQVPARVEFGLRMRPVNPLKTSVYLTLAYQDWSQYSLEYGDSLSDGTTHFDYPLQETFTISGSVEHWVSDQVPFRAGFAWIESPLADVLATARFSAGSGWVSGPLHFDIAVQLSSISYNYQDIFVPVLLTPNAREHVRETDTKYSLSVSYQL